MNRTRNLLLLGLGLFLGSQSLHAQLPNISKDGVASVANAGKLISQFTDALKPASFTDAWSADKAGFLGKASKVTSAVSMASTISTLAGYIKPSMFKTGSSASGIMGLANKAKTLADATSVLKSLEGGLKPEAFLGSWSGQRPAWLSALSLLK